MLLVLRSTSTSSATSVTASTAGYGGWAGGDHTMGGGGAGDAVPYIVGYFTYQLV